MTRSLTPRRRPATGSSLIEILVAALLLSLGIMALATMQSSASQMSRMSVFKQEAARLSLDYAERVRANPAAQLSLYQLTVPYTGVVAPVPVPSTCTNQNVCSADAMATRDVAEMREQARTSLPNGALSVQTSAVNGSNFLDIWVIWRVTASRDNTASIQGMGCPVGIVQSGADTTRCLLTRIAL